MNQGIYLPWQLADLEVNRDATLLSFSPEKKIPPKTSQIFDGFRRCFVVFFSGFFGKHKTEVKNAQVLAMVMKKMGSFFGGIQ